MRRFGQVCEASLFLLVACMASSSEAGAADGSASGRRPDVEIYMAIAATPAEIQAVRTAVRRSPSVRKYRFLSHADTYAEFKSLFRDEPDLIATTTPDQLPTSFRITLRDKAKRARLVRQWQRLPAVDEVKYRDPSDPMTKFIEQTCRSAGQGQLENARVTLEGGATRSQISALRKDLRRDPRVLTVAFISKRDAHREFERLFTDQPELVESTPADAFPASFRVALRKHASTQRFAQATRRLPGVDAVETSTDIRIACNQIGIGSGFGPAPVQPIPTPIP